MTRTRGARGVALTSFGLLNCYLARVTIRFFYDILMTYIRRVSKLLIARCSLQEVLLRVGFVFFLSYGFTLNH